MLDLQLIRHDPQTVLEGISKRWDAAESRSAVDRIVQLDAEHRALIGEVEESRRNRKLAAKAYAEAKRRGEDVDPPASDRQALGTLEERLRQVAQELNDRLLELPNLPAEDVVPGGKEANRVVRTWGTRPENTVLDHVQLAERLGLVDHARGVKLAGTGFWIYTGLGARLEWALIDWFIERNAAAGYQFVLPPHILLDSAGVAAGQFPKFADDVYHLERERDERGQFLLPTAETAILGMYQDEILDAAELPLKVFAYTPCYRLERAGTHSDERGTVRGHQFNKVEAFQFVRPADADNTLTQMVEHVESLVEALGLHYQRTLLAAGDASASMRKTMDIEVWMPSAGKYKEVSSVSWAGDYQARRAGIRYRDRGSRTTDYVHTLNGSALATSRVVPAILEQFQDGDSVVVPEVLRSRLGCDRLTVD